MKVIIAPTDPEAKHAVEATVTSVRDDLTIHEVMEMMVGALAAYGFHPDTIRSGVYNLAVEYEAEEKLEEDDGLVD